MQGVKLTRTDASLTLIALIVRSNISLIELTEDGSIISPINSKAPHARLLNFQEVSFHKLSGVPGLRYRTGKT